jgi:uncharacterized protein
MLEPAPIVTTTAEPAGRQAEFPAAAASRAAVASPLAGPVTESERIAPLDTLRGFALLGILVMNIQAFSMINAAYMNPSAYGDLTGANWWVWYLSHVLADTKMMTAFSMLFGAGIVLMTSRAEAATGRSAGVHYRRMGILVLFGLLHGYLLWFGDILYAYGMCGMAAYLFRRFRPTTLIGLGLVGLALPTTVSLGFGWWMQQMTPGELTEFTHEMWRPTPQMVAEQLAAYRGGWLTEIVHRAPTMFMFQTFFFMIYAWRVLGQMLIGMALFKLGIYSAARSTGTYLAMIGVAVFVGLPTIMYGAYRNIESGWDVTFVMPYGSQFNYWASVLVSLGWVGVVMLACKTPALSVVTRPLAAVGQMAFSNYLLHTLICTTIFYGRGFGLYGYLDRVTQIAIVFTIWIVQLIVSPIWLEEFRFGPAEWLWRSLTYGKLQPIRRERRVEQWA